jgi:hypothetical protein
MTNEGISVELVPVYTRYQQFREYISKLFILWNQNPTAGLQPVYNGIFIKWKTSLGPKGKCLCPSKYVDM